MSTSTKTDKVTKSWIGAPRYVLPSIILVLFLALSLLAFFRAGERLRSSLEERYISTSKVFSSHLGAVDPFSEHHLHQVQAEIDALCARDNQIRKLEYLGPGHDGILRVLAGNLQTDLGRPATAIEKRVYQTGKPIRQWTEETVEFNLSMYSPVRTADGETVGGLSWAIETGPGAPDEEALLFAVGFVLLLLGMILYYYRQFQRMKEYFAEKDRTAVELRRLSAAVDQSANMIVITGVDGVIEYVNPRFSELTGYTSEEAVGRLPNLIKSGMHPQEFYGELWKTISNKQTWTGQVRNRRKNGELFWERKTISPVIDDRGNIQNYLSVGEDITSELRTQQQIIEKDKMSAIGMLAAGVAHEFKNYLGGIMGNASLALEDIDKPGGLKIARDALEMAVDLSEKANRVAMSLLTYSRSRPEVVGPEDIREIIEQSLSLVSKEMANRSIEIATYFEKVPKLRVSASKIQQLLLNLLINAAHAVRQDGVITIALFNLLDSIKIVVGDSGSGIAPDRLNQVFDPFYSSKGVWGRDNVTGTGMGLPICRNIVREYDGHLSVESVQGIGTAFTVILPKVESTERIVIPDARTAGEMKFLLFTTDKSLLGRLHGEASAAGVKLMMVDNVASVPGDVSEAADLVVCDARFPAKGELQRLVDSCEKSGVPCVTAFSEQLEYPLVDVQDRSLKTFDGIPTIQDLIIALERSRRKSGHGTSRRRRQSTAHS